jgi:TetR/AcrR family transcriptional repressor of nem operon
MGKGAETRIRILETAECSVLAKGLDATSIEEIIAEAGITKSGFFYHFRDKNELAREMVRRFIERNNEIFDEIFGRGRQLSENPLEAFLIGLKLLAEILADVKAKHPGCLIASICYQERMFDREVVEMVRKVAADWNVRFRGYIDEIAAVYPIRDGIEASDLADALTCMIDGGILMAKIMNDPARLERQVLTYRSFVRLAFAPAAAAARPLRVAGNDGATRSPARLPWSEARSAARR